MVGAGIMPRRTEPAENALKVGARVHELRLARNMSLADLANAAALSKGHLSSVEHGLAAITVETVASIARGLGVPAMYLFAFSADGDRERILNTIMEFPPRELAQLRKDVQARAKALPAQSGEPNAPKASKRRKS